MMEKRNVVEGKRTPDHELERTDGNWDKEAATEFKQLERPDKPAVPPAPVKVQQPKKPVQFSNTAPTPIEPIKPVQQA